MKTIITKEELLKAIENGMKHYTAMYYASAELKKDKELVVWAVSHDSNIINLLVNNLRFDKDVAIAAVKQSPYSLSLLSECLRDDEDVVIAAINKSFHSLIHASERLQKKYRITDREIAINEVKRAAALHLLCDELRDDKEIVLISVNKNGFTFEDASERLRDDEDVFLAAVGCDRYNKYGLETIFSYASERLQEKYKDKYLK